MEDDGFVGLDNLAMSFVCGGTDLHDMARKAAPAPLDEVARLRKEREDYCALEIGQHEVAQLRADLALARAVLDSAREVDDKPGEVLLAVDRPAWRRWQGQEGDETL
jgi:hypothetical protein